MQKIYRRLYILIAAALMIPVCADAQVGKYRNDFAVGFSGGYQLNNVAFVPEVTQRMLGGINMGVTARYTCEKYFSTICAVQMELNYAELGWKEDITDVDRMPCVNNVSGLPEEYERRIRYIQLPLLANLGWGREEKGLKFFITLGPQFGYMIGESTKTNFAAAEALNTTPSRVNTVTAQYDMPVENKFDFGITGGGGLEVSLKRVGHILLEARYYYGLGNIYGDSKSDAFSRSNHNSIVFKGTYLFDIVRTKNRMK